jgi:hypothetical protein
MRLLHLESPNCREGSHSRKLTEGVRAQRRAGVLSVPALASFFLPQYCVPALS